ncbi:MAG: reactive intermediate/imine deaminase [Crocinitomicaceae bacterium]|nr:reactive intermediate/imine deaminase [Crocinitomicaceae bacterium]
MKRIIETDKAPAPIGPYNQATEANNTLYVSGQIAINPATGELEINNLEQETHRVLTNLKAIVEAAGYSMEDIVKCSIFISDMNMFNSINTIYASYFNEKTAPARETVQVAGLPKNVNVEISAIAVK